MWSLFQLTPVTFLLQDTCVSGGVRLQWQMIMINSSFCQINKGSDLIKWPASFMTLKWPTFKNPHPWFITPEEKVNFPILFYELRRFWGSRKQPRAVFGRVNFTCKDRSVSKQTLKSGVTSIPLGTSSASTQLHAVPVCEVLGCGWCNTDKPTQSKLFHTQIANDVIIFVCQAIVIVDGR